MTTDHHQPPRPEYFYDKLDYLSSSQSRMEETIKNVEEKIGDLKSDQRNFLEELKNENNDNRALVNNALNDLSNRQRILERKVSHSSGFIVGATTMASLLTGALMWVTQNAHKLFGGTAP